MCYSAMVQQNAKRYALRFKARIQTDFYYDLFRRRLDGERVYVNRAMEAQFLDSTDSPEEEKIRDLIVGWNQAQIPVIQAELAKQQERFNDATTLLQKRSTKKAANDIRIASAKIAKLEKDLSRLQNPQKTSETDTRIFPLHFTSMICTGDNGERVVRPVRYLMRPHDKDSDFDVKYNGCYNARFDTLQSVPWWKNSLGKRHGIVLISKFFENVSREAYARHNVISDSDAARENLVVSFKPEGTDYIPVPVLWDVWKDPRGGNSFYSAAIITDDPRPDVLRAGHDRTIIVLSDQGTENWLDAVHSSAGKAIETLNERKYPAFTYAVE